MSGGCDLRVDAMKTGGWFRGAEGRESSRAELWLSCHVSRRFLSRFLHQPQATRSLPLLQLLIIVMETSSRLHHHLCTHQSFSSSKCCTLRADTSPPKQLVPTCSLQTVLIHSLPAHTSPRSCRLEKARISTATPLGVCKHPLVSDLPEQTQSVTSRRSAGAGWASLGGHHWVGIAG